MTKFRISPTLFIVLLVVAFFGISLLFRIYAPYNQLYIGDTIKYANNDSYFYMRLVDNVSAHFPQLTQFDPYYIFPGGYNTVALPFFHWIIAVLAWIFGGGHPTQHLIDVIGTYLPAIMGALTVVPVFFIGKMLFNKWAGVLAAGLMAIFPGEFLARSMLGATDDPIAEILFTTIALAFLIYAIKKAQENQFTFSHLFKRDWKIILKPLIASLFAGVFLGLYLITWQGALLFVFIISLYLIIQFIINHMHHKSSDYLCFVSFVTFLIGFIILLINPYTSDITIVMGIAILIPLVLFGISKALSNRGMSTYYYPLILIGIAVVAVLIVYFAVPGVYSSLLAKIKFVFFPSGASAATTTEMSPVLMPQGDFTTLVAWGNFSTSFFIAPWWLLPGLAFAGIVGYAIYSANRRNSGTSLLVFFIIGIAMLIAITVQQWPSSYAISDQGVTFIPGIAFIALSVLLYLFVKGDKHQPWYISVGWVLAILATLTALVLFATFQNLRYLTLIPLAILIYVLFKRKDGDEHLRLFIIWCLIIFIIPMIQRRFQYYLVVNIALLSGYLAWEIIRASGIGQLFKKPEDTTKKELAFAVAPKKRDYYEALGVSRNASYKEIKSAFRKQTSTYHPSPSTTPEEQERFKELNRAYQTLTNPSQRASYDNSVRETSERNKWKNRKHSQGKGIYVVNVVLSIVVVFLFIFCPNISKIQSQSSSVPFAISNDWQIALDWMRDNTPEPMGDPNAYYKYYDAVPAGQSFNYPDSAYGVTSWWDYGYWIIRIAHRIPSANPSQSVGPTKNVAAFFLSQNQTATDALRKQLGSLYVISDYDTSVGKFQAMVQWAGQNLEKYLPVYYMQQGTQLVPIQVFSFNYYNSFIVRLYNFDGKAVKEGKPTVITYKMIKVNDNLTVKQLLDYKEYNTYQEAVDFIASQTDATKLYDIVGTD
ncbi:MAG: STT3 domain-containing protein, partial [Dehalococcoidales bacterium]